MEILSPVGAKEQLIAAVRSGTNAVYLGLKDFNARRNADNFENLEETVSYCHSRNVKVYITLNTLIKDSEITKAADTIKKIARAGADAIIVQDLGVYHLIKNIAPDIPLHASTQMSIHNTSGVKVLENMNFDRVVPARELSLDELKKIRSESDIELEVFVHGALCMCISGQCYLSSVLGARSANRGLCAQPCRLGFKSADNDHALSLKDLSVIKDIKTLELAGINSAKIEGRMKRPEYVSATTDACSKALRGEEFDLNTLKAIFSRSGFTDGYIYNKRGRDMFGYRTKEDVVSAAPVLKNIANSYRNENPLVAINMHVLIKENSPIKLTVYDNDIKVSVDGVIPEKAINREIDENFVARSLEKCGGTPYFLDKLTSEIDKGLSVPVSALNNLRKIALSEFEKEKGKTKPFKISDFEFIKEKVNEKSSFKKQCVYARFENIEQISENVDKIILDFDLIYNNQYLCKQYKDKLVAELPALLFSESNVIEKLKKLKELGITQLYVPNLYGIHLAQICGMKMIGGYGLNILNSLSLKEYEHLGITETEISFETSLDNFNSMQKNIPCGLIAYGKMPLMTFRNCPIKSESGCSSCNCKGELLDRFDNTFTVLCKDRKYGRLLNPQPIYMGDKKHLLKSADFLTLYFTDESAKECIKIINRFKSEDVFDDKFTRGLYFKEIF